MEDKKTCQDLIYEQFKSRNQLIKEMTMMVDGRFDEQVQEAVEEFIEKVTTSSGAEPDEEEIEKFIEEQHKNCEHTETSLDEFPIGVSYSKIIKVQFSWGGPADFMEIYVSGYPEQESIEKVMYHYQDWFDGASMLVPEDSEMFEYASWFYDMYPIEH
jgi:hypothetical protein